jgi:hypothetical protein
MLPNILTGCNPISFKMRILLFSGIILCSTGCQEKIFTGNVNCDECYTDKPDSAILFIDVTINDDYREVPLVLYREEYEKDQIDYRDTTAISDYWVWVAVDQEYSVKVEYAYDSDTIYVVDATKIKAKRVSEECDEVCWVVVNDRIDARLKF